MDAEPELLPVLPALLAELEDLGARAVDVVAVLQHAALPPGARGLDLGCGKGAAALAVAERFGLQMLGLDALPAFVEHARAAADRRGLLARCHFDVGDLRARVAAGGDFDLVMMLALGDLLGDSAETVAALRACVRPGGYLLIDDAYLAPDADPDDPALQGCSDRAGLVAGLCAQGDRVVHERVIDGPGEQAFYAGTTARIVARCEQLAPQHPALAEAIRAFAERQRQEVALLSGPVVGALWLLQRSE